MSPVAAAAVDLREDGCFAAGAAAASDPATLDYDCTGPPPAGARWLWLRIAPAAVAALPPGFDLVVGQTRLAHLVMVTRDTRGRVMVATIDATAVAVGQWAYGGLFHLKGGTVPVAAMYLGFDRAMNFAAIRRIEAVAPARFAAQQSLWLIVIGVFVGGIVASLVGSLFFYRAMRSPAHLWYAGWAIVILACGITRTSLVFLAAPVTDSNAVVRISLVLIAAATGASVMFFVACIEPGVLSCRFKRGAVALAGIGPALAIVATMDRWLKPQLALALMGAVVVAQIAMIAAGSIVALTRSSRAARFYLIASVLPLAGLLLTITSYYVDIGHSEAVDMATLGALTLQAILLFVGHADRFAILHREHRAATNEQAILRRLSEVVFELSNDGCWTFLNPAWEDLSGERVEDALGKRFAAYLHADDRGAITAADTALRRGEIADYRGLARHVRANGTIRWIALRLHLRRDDSGAIVGTGGSLHDITERHLSAIALAASEQRHRALTEVSIAGIFECDAAWQVRYVNPAYSRLCGLSRERALGRGWLDALRADDRAQVERLIVLQRASPALDPSSNILCFVHADGSEHWGLSGMTAIIDDDGQVTGYSGMTLDITEEHLAREALTTSQMRFEALARLSPAVIFRTDPRGRCSFANAAWQTLTGRAPEQALGFGYVEAVDPLDRARLERGWRTIGRTDAADPGEYRFRHVDGGVRWTTIATARELDADGELVGFVGVITDITAQKSLELELTTARAAAELAATTDELTGLANRRQFMARLGQAVARHRDGTPPALAIVDVDHFKRINDTLGHPSGDEVLRAVGRILRANIRSTDLVGRVGGEEFALLMPGADADLAATLCERIRSVIAASRFGTTGGTVLRVTVSAGIATLIPGETVAELIQRTDKALYLSKNAGRNQVQLAA